MDISTQDIKFLPGVGLKKAALLKEELNVFTFEQLLYYYPYKYVDRTRFYKIRELTTILSHVQIRGKFISFEKHGKPRMQRLSATFSDGESNIEVVWFRGFNQVIDRVKPGVEYILFGKPSAFKNTFSMVHPEIEEEQADVKRPALQAFYNTTEKMKNAYLSSRGISTLQHNLFLYIKSGGDLSETLPAKMIKPLGLMRRHDALVHIHFPKDQESLRRAQYRLKFEELFYIQLGLLKKRNVKLLQYQGFVFDVIGDFFNDFYKECIPFELTNAQKRVIREIREDTKKGKQMNRLLQGDVGSGKTMVALMTMLMAVDNGFQSCMMAPTEILATQHYISIVEMLSEIPLEVALLTGSTKKKDREVIHEKLRSGELKILIGTHALLEDVVKFDNLGLVVIDEQHRFGVAQRAKLWQKNSLPPHILVMTATPIPRTLAMTLYGDLDISVIDELPPGRKPITTYHFYDDKRASVYSFIRKQIAQGRQIYVVYPIIQESEKLDFKNLEAGYEELMFEFPEPNYRICMVHGKMKAEKKQQAMEAFAQGNYNIMVATTVIEVGVNVPNSTVMLIESSERFGLSQLHQLRGRVGRGAEQSFCILMSTYKLSKEGRTRLETMVNTNDGFEIAEVDLKLRGPGDLEGTQQSGVPFDLKIASLAKDGSILQYARQVVESILLEDPLLEQSDNRILNDQLKRLVRNSMNWGMIS